MAQGVTDPAQRQAIDFLSQELARYKGVKIVNWASIVSGNFDMEDRKVTSTSKAKAVEGLAYCFRFGGCPLPVNIKLSAMLTQLAVPCCVCERAVHPSPKLVMLWVEPCTACAEDERFAGACVLRQFLDETDDSTGLPWKNLYGWVLHTRGIERLSPEQVEWAENTDPATGKGIPAEEFVRYC